jgi:hypothetical protein
MLTERQLNLVKLKRKTRKVTHKLHSLVEDGKSDQ